MISRTRNFSDTDFVSCDLEPTRIGHGLTKDELRFWRKVAVGDECWAWLGSVTRRGYGMFSLRGGGGSKGNQIMRSAHRHCFAMIHGYLPAVVRHACDNKRCVRPSHLLGGTHLENMADMVDRNRQAKGAKHGSAKLGEADIDAIRNSTAPRRQIAATYAVSVSLIDKIRSGKRWGNRERDARRRYGQKR
jgi:hypothetical protein